ncbi:MAG TPA: glutamyl-tRNA reductase [Dissulfurispiraceae bacterium]|nr:glutamyl-tRNA reductase [Dissulfurispiraceae bacterium]
MNFFVIGLNHKTASVEIRERLAFNGARLEKGLLALRQTRGVSEAALLSTCNRVEIYASADNAPEAADAIKDFLATFHDIARPEFEKTLYVREMSEAVRHVFRVASSLDSMIIGEPQILGQLKDAFEFALAKKTTGVILNRLMKKAISTAKRVRTETRIAENAVSISFAAVELAKKIFTGLPGKSFMLLGAGEMAELAARHLVNNGVTDVRVANRTYDRACELAKEFCGCAVRFEEFVSALVETDILICSTGAPSYVLFRDQMQKVMKQRKHRPVFIIDISVPRNIDPEINKIDNVYLYNVDDLQEVVDTNILERKKEAAKAEAIIEEEVEKFSHWAATLDSVPVIVALRQKADDIRREEIEKFRNRFPDLDKDKMDAVEGLANAITNKLMHNPTVALRESVEDREMMTIIIKKLYGIDGEDDE